MVILTSFECQSKMANFAAVVIAPQCWQILTLDLSCSSTWQTPIMQCCLMFQTCQGQDKI